MPKFLLLYATLVLPSISLAMSATPSGAAPQPTLELGLGTSYTRFNYKELCTPSDQEGANYSSTVGNLKIHLPDAMSFIEGEYESGSTNSTYSGAALSTGQSVIATDKLTFTDYAVKLNFAMSDTVFLYVGYGHHKWLRVLNGAYAETYQWDFIPVGMTAWYLRGDVVDLGIDVSFMPMLNANIHADTSDYQPGGQDSDAGLGNKTGFKIKMPVVWHYGLVSLETSPWFEHTEIGQSDPFINQTLFSSSPYRGFEPSSETYIFGFEAMLSVKF